MLQILLGQDQKKFNEKYKKTLKQLKTEPPETDTTKIDIITMSGYNYLMVLA